MRKIFIALVLTICLSCALLLPACTDPYEYQPLKVYVRFLNNTDGETTDLQSGRTAITEDVLFELREVKIGDVITKPTTNPTRAGFDFVCWTTEKKKDNEVVYVDYFADPKPITGSLNLYAKWQHSEGGATAQLDYTEPTLNYLDYQVKVDDSGADFTLNEVCNQPVKNGKVQLTTIGIKRLTHGASNVLEYLKYTRKSTTDVTKALYQDGQVKVTYTAGGSEHTVAVTVEDITATLKIEDDPATRKESIDESTFETKALRYEAAVSDFEYASYNVIMGGSSSMENWADSVEDMAPVTTKNVGIGGSSAATWRDYLADRLIIPYNPRAVVLYVGINDIINYNLSGEKAAKNITDLLDYLHERLPDATIHFILINHVPGYYSVTTPAKSRDCTTAIDTANNAVLEYAKTHSFLNTIDAGKVLEKKTGDYSEQYFMNDGLHMNPAGYYVWGPVVKAAVIAKDKELYDND